MSKYTIILETPNPKAPPIKLSEGVHGDKYSNLSLERAQKICDCLNHETKSTGYCPVAMSDS